MALFQKKQPDSGKTCDCGCHVTAQDMEAAQTTRAEGASVKVLGQRVRQVQPAGSGG